MDLDYNYYHDYDSFTCSFEGFFRNVDNLHWDGDLLHFDSDGGHYSIAPSYYGKRFENTPRKISELITIAFHRYYWDEE